MLWISSSSGKVHDEPAIRIEIASGMQAADERVVPLDALEGRLAHARHQPHVGGDVGAVRDLDAAAGVG